MANARKKWRLQLVPVFTEEPATSKVDAYRRVEKYREDRAAGRGRIYHVNVQVHEDGVWRLYERIPF